MNNSSLQQIIGGLFAVALVLALAGLLLSWGSATALTTIVVVLIGALVLVAVLPRVRELNVGAQGVGAKLSELGDAVRETKAQVEDQGKQLENQQEMLNLLVKYSMSASIFAHMCGITLLKNYTYHDGDSDRREMYFLRDNGFIRPKSGAFLDFSQSLNGRNLVDYAEPTPIGWASVRLRKDEIPANMRDDKSNLRVDLTTL